MLVIGSKTTTPCRENSDIDIKDKIITMKRIFSLFLLAAILLTSFSLASCGNKLKFKDGYYYCEQNGVSYQFVSFEYVPVAIGQEFAIMKDGQIEYKFHEIQGATSDKWITTSDGNLFCAVGEKIPTLGEMDVSGILVCYEQTNVISLATIRNESEITSIKNDFISGDTVKFPNAEVDQHLKLRFSSEEYPWLYYCLSYVEYAIDICEYDEPEDLNSYTYRDVSDSVVVTTSTKYKCWYKVGSKSEEDGYVAIAENAGVEFGKLTKPNGDGTVSDYVVFYFDTETTVEECVDTVVANYKNGSLTETKLREKLSSPYKSESKNIVEYNYGRYFIYDNVNGKCVRTNDIVHKYKNGT